MQRKGSRAIRVDDDRDDFADPCACAVGEKRVEQSAADTLADSMRGDVHRILDRVAVSRPRLPRCAVRVARYLVVEDGGQKRQSGSGDRVKSAQPFGGVGRGEFKRGDAGSHVVAIDIADRAEVIG